MSKKYISPKKAIQKFIDKRISYHDQICSNEANSEIDLIKEAWKAGRRYEQKYGKQH